MGKYDKQVKEILSVTAVTILCTAATENKIDGQKMKDLSQELDPKVGGKHQKRGERSDDVEMREVLSDWYEQGLCDMKGKDVLLPTIQSMFSCLYFFFAISILFRSGSMPVTDPSLPTLFAR